MAHFMFLGMLELTVHIFIASSWLSQTTTDSIDFWSTKWLKMTVDSITK